MTKTFYLWRFVISYNKHRLSITDGTWCLGIRANTLYTSILLGYLSLSIYLGDLDK